MPRSDAKNETIAILREQNAALQAQVQTLLQTVCSIAGTAANKPKPEPRPAGPEVAGVNAFRVVEPFRPAKEQTRAEIEKKFEQGA